MASNDVKYLRGTRAQYDAYLAAGKLVSYYYYLIYETVVGEGDPVLYIGKKLLSEEAEIAAVVARVAELEDQIPTLQEAIDNASHAFYEVTVLPEFVEGHSYKEGDVAILTISQDGVDYKTAYHCMKDAEGDLVWAAMAGNYNASNVYYDKNIQVTKSVGNVTTSNNAPVDLVFKGKNMEQIWQYLYATEDKSLSITQPNASMSVSGSKTAEVGNTFSDPVITISFSDGQYEYGSKDANGNSYSKAQGAGVLWNAATIYGSDGTTVLATKTTSSNSSLTYTYDISDNVIHEGSTTYSFSGKASCPASSRKPVTNLGNFLNSSNEPTTVYADGTKNTAAITDKALSGSMTVKGERYCFYGYKASGATLDVNNLTSAQIRALGNGSASLKAYSTSSPWTTNKMQQMFFAAPKGKYSSITVANATNGAPQTVLGPVSVSVEGYNGYAAAEYDVFYVNNDNPDGGESKYAITIA